MQNFISSRPRIQAFFLFAPLLAAGLAVSSYTDLLKAVWPADLSPAYLYPATVPETTAILSVGVRAAATFLSLRLDTSRSCFAEVYINLGVLI
ncbi:MAG: hypothetical protein PVG78_07160 [Desulfobacterales bacterium]|jgi:hypothetical protein